MSNENVSSYDNFSPSFSLLRRACGIEPFRLFLLKFLLNHRNNIHIGEHDHKECYNRICQGETYMNDKDFILARNSGTPPVKLLFDKSLKFVRIKSHLHV